MTLTEAQAMTPEEKNVKLAELRGTARNELGIHYKDRAPHYSFGNSEEYTRQKCANYQRQGINCELVERSVADEDYCNDLNAVHEVEKGLSEAQSARYAKHLYQSDAITYAILDHHEEVIWETIAEFLKATADQRTTALILTLSQA